MRMRTTERTVHRMYCTHSIAQVEEFVMRVEQKATARARLVPGGDQWRVRSQTSVEGSRRRLRPAGRPQCSRCGSPRLQ